MNYFLLGYLIVFLSYLEKKNGFRVYAEIERRGKDLFPVVMQNIQPNSWGILSTYAPEPEFVGDIPSIKVVAGKDATLRCVVENLGHHQVMWKIVKSKILLSLGTNVFIKSERFEVTTSNSTSWYLHIKTVTHEDIGYYACQINTIPTKSQAGYLDVVEPPEFATNMTNRNVTVMENSNVTLSCKATGNPPPVIKWRREDEQEFTVGNNKTREYINEELRFIGVTREHMAAYICAASNEVPPAISRRIYLDVKFPPLIWIQNQLVGARENIDVSLECQTEGHPMTDNFWLRDEEPVVSKSSRYQTNLARNFYKSYMKLTIRNLQPEDYGYYQCVAKNSFGETQGTIKLFKHVQPTPLPTKPSTEDKIVYPTRRIVTASVTTERKFLITDLERLENINSHGNQQSSRVGDDVENTAIRTYYFNLYFIIVFLSSVGILWILDSNR